MAKKLTDKVLKGKKFGRWTILGISHRKNRQVFVKVICDCGTKSVVPYHANLRSGKRKVQVGGVALHQKHSRSRSRVWSILPRKIN